LPLVYEELRKLAAQKLSNEKPGQTLDATALVHEAYLRLLGVKPVQCWESRGHFFAAAAEAMRRILVDQARRKQAGIHGGGRQRVELPEDLACATSQTHDLVALDDALTRLEKHRLWLGPVPEQGRPDPNRGYAGHASLHESGAGLWPRRRG
jgi:RNA polymerase sigma factor (TIGR02999 family)